MKTNYSFKCVITLVLFAFSAFSFQMKGDAVVINGIAYNLDDELSTAETAALPDDAKYTGTLTIPASVENGGATYAVKKIGDNSLRDAPELTAVIIPEGLEVIGNSSFASCTGITSLQLPSSVNSIEDWAFYGCSNLATINIPGGVPSIGEHVFQNSGLTSITLPESVTSVKVCAFQDASSLASINLENVTEIGGYALYGTAITSVTIGNVLNIKGEAFRNCALLEEITFSGTVSIIEAWTFNNTGLRSVVLPEGLVNLGDAAFSDCLNLSSVTIPASLKILRDWIFSSGPMEEIHVSWDNPSEVSVSENAFGNTKGTPEWIVPANLKDLYGDVWNGFPVSVATSIDVVQTPGIKIAGEKNAIRIMNDKNRNATVNIYAINGAKVYTLAGQIGDTTVELPAGVYIVKITSPEGAVTNKTIVK
jgi:hypothetical protein